MKEIRAAITPGPNATQEEWEKYLDNIGLSVDAGEYTGGEKYAHTFSPKSKKWEEKEDSNRHHNPYCPIKLGHSISDAMLGVDQPGDRPTENAAFDNLDLKSKS